MAHYKATIEYDGTEFYGFQRQPKVRTIQGVLEDVLSTLAGGIHVPIRGAGRTDSGVHATGQVVDFHLTFRDDLKALQRALNVTLPKDVAVCDLSLAPTNFHPRYDALSRAYVYTILNTPIRQPLKRRSALHEWPLLNEQAMHDGLQRLLGQHDFASFGRPTTPSGNTTRILKRGRVWREGEKVYIALEANGFLYRMVRSIVGSLLLLGRNKKTVDWIEEVLAARDRGMAGTVVKPHGLCLIAVRYPDSSPNN